MQQMQNRQHAQRSLSRQDSLILASLVHEPKHALALREVIEQTEGVRVEPGALYRLVARLEQRGWIEGEDVGRPLHLYHLTARGILALQNAEAGCQREQQQERWNPALRGGKEHIMHLVIWVLRLYPPAWRERYEAEMVALLEQHDITFWTVLDLLVWGLDARLDPHYRRSSSLVSFRRLQTSWWLIIGAGVAFWLGLTFWSSMSDMGIPPGATWCNVGGECAIRQAVGTLTPPSVSNIGILAVFTFLVFVASLAQTLKSGEAFRIGGNTWEKRPNLLFACFVRLLSLLVTGGMGFLCIVCGVWLVAIWNLFPRINLYYPGTQTQLLLGFIVMVLTTMTAFFALVRSTLALRAVYVAPSKQDPLQQAHE
jgi:DNA-binding PadR family transcriptional regulator